VIVGNGTPDSARALREEFGLDCPVVLDPDLVAYRAAGLRRGRVEMLSPRVPLDGLRAYMGGARQSTVQGDIWQLGGLFVVCSGGRITFEHVSTTAGHHPALDQILAMLDIAAPTAAAT